MGLSAVPLPMKNRINSAIGLTAGAAAAVATTGAVSATASGSTGSPVVSEAAGAMAGSAPDVSRRVAASAAQANAAATGAWGSAPPPTQSSGPVPASDNRPSAAAAVMNGASLGDCTAAVLCSITAAGPKPGSATRSISTAEIATDRPSPLATAGTSTEPPPAADSPTIEETSGKLSLIAGSDTAAPPSRDGRESRSPGTSGLAGRVATRPSREVPANSEPGKGSEEHLGARSRFAPRERLVPAFSPEWSDDPAEAVESTPADPPDSAAATPGRPMIAPPTPNATASAPTRPTQSVGRLTAASDHAPSSSSTSRIVPLANRWRPDRSRRSLPGFVGSPGGVVDATSAHIGDNSSPHTLGRLIGGTPPPVTDTAPCCKCHEVYHTIRLEEPLDQHKQ